MSGQHDESDSDDDDDYSDDDDEEGEDGAVVAASQNLAPEFTSSPAAMPIPSHKQQAPDTAGPTSIIRHDVQPVAAPTAPSASGGDNSSDISASAVASLGLTSRGLTRSTAAPAALPTLVAAAAAAASPDDDSAEQRVLTADGDRTGPVRRRVSASSTALHAAVASASSTAPDDGGAAQTASTAAAAASSASGKVRLGLQVGRAAIAKRGGFSRVSTAVTAAASRTAAALRDSAKAFADELDRGL